MGIKRVVPDIEIKLTPGSFLNLENILERGYSPGEVTEPINPISNNYSPQHIPAEIIDARLTIALTEIDPYLLRDRQIGWVNFDIIDEARGVSTDWTRFFVKSFDGSKVVSSKRKDLPENPNKYVTYGDAYLVLTTNSGDIYFPQRRN